MSNFSITLLATIVVMIVAVLCLAIGWLITGKVKMKRGSCGYNPQKNDKKKQSSCGSESSCELCSPEKKSSNSKSKNNVDN